ncbi:MAG: glycosyltransferase family 2 protein [Beijerinckiaceae bacterium]
MPHPTFSVLLPTRNRLDLVRGAVETVRRQDFTDWEIILADNCSDDDVAGYAAALGDARVRYIRSDEPLPVTANWNRAIDAARGDYIIMLGDDDGLTPGYMSRMLAEMEASGDADFAFHGAYHFTFPGVLPSVPEGSLVDATRNHAFLGSRTESGVLPRAEAETVACAALRLTALYGFNMQYFLFRRCFIERLRRYGDVFQGPFPDFYVANLAMLIAERVWLVPRPMVVVGISPKSYGFHHFNNREGQGTDFLGIGGYLADRSGAGADLLPGPTINSAWYLSVALVAKHLGQNSPAKLGTDRYRRLQIFACEAAAARGELKPETVDGLAGRLGVSEQLYRQFLRLLMVPARLLPREPQARWLRLLSSLLARQYPRHPPVLPPAQKGAHASMLDVFGTLAAGSPSVGTGS